MLGRVPLTVNVDRGCRGGWKVDMPDQHKPVSCETLGDAKRIAYLYAAERQPCQLVIRDAYHRVVRRELIDGEPADKPTRTLTPA